MNISVVMMRLGRYGEAEKTLLELLDLVKDTFGNEHRRVSSVLHNLGELKRLQGVPEEGIPYLREAARISREGSGEPGYILAMNLEQLALALHAAGELEDAVPMMRKSLDMYRATAPDLDIARLMSAVSLGRLLCDAGDYEEAQTLFSETLEVLVESRGEKSIKAMETRLVWALCRLRQTPVEETLDLVATRLEELRQSEYADPALQSEAERALAEFGE